MLLLRRFEEKTGQLYGMQKIRGFCHLYIGQEAVAAGCMTATVPDDKFITAYRDHALAIAKGITPNACMAELYGKATGCSKGKGGSMHFFGLKENFFGGHGIVGAQIGTGAGLAFAEKYRGTQNVVLCFFGDGASNRGTFHEGINMAAAWKLPVVFVCENNEWASTTPYRSTTSVRDISDRAAGYGIPRRIANGNDIFEVLDAMEEASDWVRKGEGPMFLEFKTYRVGGHFVGDPEMYRTREEVKERFTKDDPIKNFEARVIKEKWLKTSLMRAAKASKFSHFHFSNLSEYSNSVSSSNFDIF